MHQGLVGTYPFFLKIIGQKDQIIFIYNILETQRKNRSEIFSHPNIISLTSNIKKFIDECNFNQIIES
jgi:hypothetical protein